MLSTESQYSSSHISICADMIVKDSTSGYTSVRGDSIVVGIYIVFSPTGSGSRGVFTVVLARFKRKR